MMIVLDFFVGLKTECMCFGIFLLDNKITSNSTSSVILECMSSNDFFFGGGMRVKPKLQIMIGLKSLLYQ